MPKAFPSGTLLIRDIRAANLAWVRRDLGSLDDLRKSIENESGLLLPILTTPDLLVVDGARRLEAASQLGWKAIPAVATSDWSTVKRYFARARELAGEGVPTLPLSWVDLTELCAGPLKEMYAPELRRLRRNIRERNLKVAPEKKPGVNDKPYLYPIAAAEVLGLSTEDLRLIRMVVSGLAKLRRPADRGEDPVAVEQRHDWADFIQVQADESERNGGDRLSAVLARIRAANAGQDPTQIREARGRRNPGNDPAGAERRARVAAVAQLRELDGVAMKNIATLLDQLASTVKGYTHVRPTVPVSDAQAAASEMRAAVKKINSLIKVITLYGTNPNLEERP